MSVFLGSVKDCKDNRSDCQDLTLIVWGGEDNSPWLVDSFIMIDCDGDHSGGDDGNC